MFVKEKIGSLASFTGDGRTVDWLAIEWHECNKRILHKKTKQGREVALKFLKESQQLQQDDVLYIDDDIIIAVEILACEAIVIKPESMYEIALISYEIGNKHLPLFYEENNLLVPYDAPTFRLLQASGLQPEIQQCKLTNPLRTSVAPHPHNSGETLFSKILKLTAANE